MPTLIALGNSSQEIAAQLFISSHTVKTSARRIHRKLGVELRAQTVAMAKQPGVIRPIVFTVKPALRLAGLRFVNGN
ncbi:helix-turn-helix transcriptional regulator [Pseudomonas sp. NPDC086278]|uniref:helix-turn-helix transcriptional regulator n=1 Tax=Pseudomonas sp. NPDC086278 TaxID=3390646 RepID=UPI003CFD0115